MESVYEEFNKQNRLVWEAYSDRRSRNAAYILVDDPSKAPTVAPARLKLIEKPDQAIRETEQELPVNPPI